MSGFHKTVIFFVCMMLLLLGVNIMMQQALKDLDRSNAVTQKASIEAPAVKGDKTQEFAEKAKPLSGEVIRRSQVIPGDDYYENIFYQGGKVIARQKIKRGEVVEQTGEIPDGKVRVEDVNQRSMGEEYYENDQRKGLSRLYFSDGTLKAETTYSKGKVLLMKEYFSGGALHIMQDFQDALDIPGETEVGIGKVYYPDGKLRYEWNLTNTASRGFKKAYNPAGEVSMEMYFNANGEVIIE